VSSHVEDVRATAMLDALAFHSSPASRQVDTIAPNPPLDPQPVVIFEQPGGALHVGEQQQVAIEKPSLSVNLAAPEVPPPPSVAEGTGDAGPPAEDPPLSSDGAVGGTGVKTVTVPYVVGMHDTFAAICMRHQMTEDEMMRLNSLRRRHVRSGDIVLVYAERSDEESRDELQRQLVRQFRRECRCTAGEALYYLEGTGYDMDAAMQGRRCDIEWEREVEKARETRRQQALAEKEETEAKTAAPHFLRCFAQCLPTGTA